MSRAALVVAAAGLAVAAPARAHHGVAAVGVAGPEGPGAALETTSPLPLPQGTLFAMLKSELVPFQRYAFAEPTNKVYASFNTVALGYGLTPWLSAYVFQPVNVKEQDAVGRNAGPGDPNLMLALGLKWDEGLRLVPEKESLDDLEDWHFGVWGSSTVPVGPTTARDRSGAWFAPDMQVGFGAPGVGGGVAVLKQLTPDLTWLADVNQLYFFPHTYPFTRYQFGAETRADTAAVWRAHGAGRFRVDVSGELNGLQVQRDRERGAAGALEARAASGGSILYVGAGVRLYWGRVTVALAARRAALRALDEASAQQGSEGLEVIRAALSISYATPL